MKLNVNGTAYDLDLEPDMPLLWVLRDELGLTGTKYGCGIAQCGACTVHIGGQAFRSCQVPVGTVQDQEIATIESLGTADALHAVQEAWVEHQVAQCGYCQSGQIMATVALLTENDSPDDEAIDEALTNLCRCGTYPRIRAAVKSAAEKLKGA